MWRLKSAFKDGMAALLLLILFQPFGISENNKPIVAIIVMAMLTFISSILSSLLVIPFFKGKENPLFREELKKMSVEFVINTPILAIFLNSFIAWYSEGSIAAGWIVDGEWIVWRFPSVLACVVFVSIPIYIWNRDQLKKRFMKMEIDDLHALNALLESEQEKLRSCLPKDDVAEKTVIQGDSRESLSVNPLDIMYIESVGNYLNIVYFNDSDLCQKRLRSSLKEVEETLASFPFLVHIHRAFLININFITQVSGNSAGYKISMFGTDRILPVSKANVPVFREKIKELDKGLR